MARVPLQTVPGVELEAGSEVQFGATSVDPQRDVVTDDIARSGKAMQQFSQTLGKLDDEINDAEATQLSNDYHADVTDIKNRYGTLKGVNAVGMVEVDGEQISVFDQYQGEMQGVLESYQAKASNGTVKYIFENKAQVYTNSALNLMTAHSLTEQRSYKESGIKSSIELNKSAAKASYESWNNPDGDFRKFYAKGLSDITELAVLNGWDTTILEDGTYVSKQFEEKVKTYNMEVLKEVADSLGKSNDGQAELFLDWLNPEKQNEQVNEIKKKIVAKHKEHKNGVCVDKILSNNGNQNDGDLLSQADTLSCLSSNNSHDNGIGGNVTGGLNSNEVDIINKTDTEKLETLNAIRNTSKFYSPESSLNGTLIAQHQPTHLFAIQRLGVEKADSLYTKAKSSIEIDKERFKVDPEYATEINGKIITNYNKLILEASEKKYKPDIVKLKEKIAELKNQTGGGKGTKTSRKNKIIKLTAELETAESNDPKYVNKIANDLEIITNGIDYNFNPEEPGIKVDPITGLQPLDVLKAKLKATIKDPKELETAIKDLEIKYNKTKTEKETVYNGALEKAQEIAFAEPGGWKQLEANNINIDDFTEADQEILRNGPPEETDVDTEVELINNPAKVRDNLNAYRPKLSRTGFLELSNYAQELRSEDKYVEATGNTTMLKATLDRMDMGDLYTSKDKKKKKQYIAINNAWIAEINARQITKGNVKLTRGEKQAALVHVLTDKVNVDTGWWDKKNVNVHLVDQDRLKNVYVEITPTAGPYKGKKETVFISKIDPGVLALIKDSLRRAGLTVSQENIADYYLQKGKPKDTAAAYAYKEEE